MKLLRAALLVGPCLPLLVFAQKKPVKKTVNPPAASAPAPSPTPAPLSARTKIKMSQADVTRLALTQSDRAEEANLTAELPRKELAEAHLPIEWTLTAETGQEINQGIGLTSTTNAKDTSWKTAVSLKKLWITGTTTTLSWTRNSLQSEFKAGATVTTPSQATSDIFGLSLEQSLLKNAFGRSTRAFIEAREKVLASERTRRGFNLQNVVLEALRKFWAAYVAQENLKQSVQARDAYQKLVETVRRKSGYGYSGVGELSQAQAEYETRVQNLKNGAVTYVKAIDDLLAYLSMAPNADIQFIIENEVPPPPTLKALEYEKLREYRAQVEKKESTEAFRRAASSNNNIDLSLVGQIYGNGYDQNAANSLGSATSGANPKYYVGVKVNHTFGNSALSDLQLHSEFVDRIEDIKLNRMKTEIAVRMDAQEKKVQAAYAVVMSAKEQRSFRAKAERELQASYRQGRTGIRDLISAMNEAMNSDVSYSRSVGDYQTALAEWAALRDELIPEGKMPEPTRK